jgi:hypothetical protein
MQKRKTFMVMVLPQPSTVPDIFQHGSTKATKPDARHHFLPISGQTSFG